MRWRLKCQRSKVPTRARDSSRGTPCTGYTRRRAGRAEVPTRHGGDSFRAMTMAMSSSNAMARHDNYGTTIRARCVVAPQRHRGSLSIGRNGVCSSVTAAARTISSTWRTPLAISRRALNSRAPRRTHIREIAAPPSRHEDCTSDVSTGRASELASAGSHASLRKRDRQSTRR